MRGSPQTQPEFLAVRDLHACGLAPPTLRTSKRYIDAVLRALSPLWDDLCEERGRSNIRPSHDLRPACAARFPVSAASGFSGNGLATTCCLGSGFWSGNSAQAAFIPLSRPRTLSASFRPRGRGFCWRRSMRGRVCRIGAVAKTRLEYLSGMSRRRRA